VRELRPPGFVRGALSNERPYRDSEPYFKPGGKVWRSREAECRASACMVLMSNGPRFRIRAIASQRALREGNHIDDAKRVGRHTRK
jgi:hypothetical protein